MTSPEDVLAFLKRHVTSTTDCAEIAALMAHLAADSEWVHLGGSGARQQIFRLGQNLRAVVQFDAGDRLVAYGAYVSDEPWETERTSTPMSPSDVPLTVVAREP